MSTKVLRHTVLRLALALLVLGLAASAVPASATPAPARRATSKAVPAQTPAGWHSLTGILPDSASVSGATISPDSAYLVYEANDRNLNQYELYSVPLSGTQPIRLNPELLEGAGVHGFEITPDSQYVVFVADVEVVGRSDLYRVPIGGGQAVQLNSDPDSGTNIRQMHVDPGNAYVVYTAEQTVPQQFEVFSVPISGGFAPRLNPNLVPGGDVLNFEIDPYLDRVVYAADQEVDERIQLYSAPIAGSVAAVPLSPADTPVSSFTLNPQAQLVVMLAQPGSAGGWRLYSNFTSGGQLNPLTGYLTTDENVGSYYFTPNGARVVFTVDRFSTGNGLASLQTVLIGGGGWVPLALAEDDTGVYASDYQITPDSLRVVFSYNPGDNQPPIIYSSALDGSDWDILFADAEAEQPVKFGLSPDSVWLVYTTYPSYNAYRVPVTGGPIEPLPNGVVQAFLPFGSRVILTSENDQLHADILSVSLTGSETVNLSRSAHEADARDALVSPNGQWIVYRAYHFESTRNELRASDGSQAMAMIYLPLLVR